MAAPTNINEALLALQADPPVLTKNKNGHQSRYADLVQVNREVLSRLNALGVVWSCLPTLTDEGKFVLDYALVHVASGSKICGQWPLKLSENPQQMGSATTYGRRYALLAVTGIAAEDEDDDGQAASGRQVAQRRQQARPTARRASGPAPALPGEDKARGKMFALLREADLGDRDAGLAFIGEALARPVESTKDLTGDEVSTVIDRLTAYLEQSEPGGDQ
ncbi:ERF family protein [Micromonospora sp. LOL_014]|uniref:ERF family protein n=1 Tax=Micromonospora sp. LOL_014 TaxID=3345415 RepID=UPI003A8B923F